jgi:serine/threonine protein kinase
LGKALSEEGIMRICLDRTSGSGCRHDNSNDAQYCRQCGRSLRYALELHDPGTVVGHYRIGQVIGYGGFGAVYEAVGIQQPDRRVAIKETFDPEQVRSFQSEFATLHRLRHDHLPNYYEMFEAQGNGYLVMELVPGQSLADVLASRQGRPLVQSQVLGYAIQACEALAYLHSQKPVLIHRDIKPANIRLTPDGLIKLVDFGLLKQGDATTRSSRMGLTPAYAPLEQWGGTGSHTTPQTDLYSLGATLYHLLTGHAPPPATDRLTASTDPLRRPKEHNPNLAQHVSDALMRSLAIKPQDRYPDARAMQQALLTAAPIAAPPPPKPASVPTPRPAPMPPTPKPVPVPRPPRLPSRYKFEGGDKYLAIVQAPLPVLTPFGGWIGRGGASASGRARGPRTQEHARNLLARTSLSL